MNWTVFGILAYVALAMEVGLVRLLEIPTGLGPLQPRFVLVLAVVVGLFAPANVVIIAWAILGLLVDLVSVYPLTSGSAVTIIGPHTLGYMAGAIVALQLRTMVFRNHPFSVGFLVFCCGLAIELIVVLVFSIRRLYDPMPEWIGLWQLAGRLAGLGYSALVAVVLAMILLRLVPLFGFQTIKAGARRWSR